jgi:hypothetical protein
MRGKMPRSLFMKARVPEGPDSPGGAARFPESAVS